MTGVTSTSHATLGLRWNKVALAKSFRLSGLRVSQAGASDGGIILIADMNQFPPRCHRLSAGRRGAPVIDVDIRPTRGLVSDRPGRPSKCSGRAGCRELRTRSAAFSASTITGLSVLLPIGAGITEAPTTRSPQTPRPRTLPSTTQDRWPLCGRSWTDGNRWTGQGRPVASVPP